MKRRTVLAGFFAALAAPATKAAGGAVVEPVVVSEDYQLPEGRGTLQFRLTQQGATKECSIRIFNDDRDILFRLSIDPDSPGQRTVITGSFWMGGVVCKPDVSSVILNEQGAAVSEVGRYMPQFYNRVGSILSAVSEIKQDERRRQIKYVVERIEGIGQEIRIQLTPSRSRQLLAQICRLTRPAPRP